MAGHVNMMDDVLVSNLSPAILRSALRLLISQGPATQKAFVQHVRQRLVNTEQLFLPPAELFPPGSETASPALLEYMKVARCMFSSKLVEESLPYLSYLPEAIVAANATWPHGSPLEKSLVMASGDIVQAMQALKEADVEPTDNLKTALDRLLSSLQACRKYCAAHTNAGKVKMDYPFERSERQVRDALAISFPAAAALESAETPARTAPRTTTAATIAADVTMLEVKPRIMNGSTTAVETFRLGPFEAMPRLFNGFWQLSSPAWGSGTSESQTSSLLELVEAGLTAADMADHYGDAELIFGDFRNRLPQAVQSTVFCATKWCVFKLPTVAMTPQWVLENVKERSRRVGGRIDLLQFHWQDYNSTEYLNILAELVLIRRNHPELLSAVGLCNFDSEHTIKVCEHLLQVVGEVGVVSNQVQFSLFDSRPLQKMAGVCEKYGLKLLTYGSFCGGMISSKWIGQPPPEIYALTEEGSPIFTPSQRKYIDIIYTWSSSASSSSSLGWAEFQKLLGVLADIGAVHGVSLTNVATRWVLQQPAVGAVIVGTRLGVSSRWQENMRVFGWVLSPTEMARIDAVALGSDGAKSRHMAEVLGDCGSEYRGNH